MSDYDFVVDFFFFFFFKQKTAYEMRISDWSSDVCSSDLHALAIVGMDNLCDRVIGDGLIRRQPKDRPQLGCVDGLPSSKVGVTGAKTCDLHPETQPRFAFLQPAFADAQRSLVAQALLGAGAVGHHGFAEADVLLAAAVGPAPPDRKTVAEGKR